MHMYTSMCESEPSGFQRSPHPSINLSISSNLSINQSFNQSIYQAIKFIPLSILFISLNIVNVSRNESFLSAHMFATTQGRDDTSKSLDACEKCEIVLARDPKQYGSVGGECMMMMMMMVLRIILLRRNDGKDANVVEDEVVDDDVAEDEVEDDDVEECDVEEEDRTKT